MLEYLALSLRFHNHSLAPPPFRWWHPLGPPYWLGRLPPCHGYFLQINCIDKYNTNVLASQSNKARFIVFLLVHSNWWKKGTERVQQNLVVLQTSFFQRFLKHPKFEFWPIVFHFVRKTRPSRFPFTNNPHKRPSRKFYTSKFLPKNQFFY